MDIFRNENPRCPREVALYATFSFVFLIVSTCFSATSLGIIVKMVSKFFHYARNNDSSDDKRLHRPCTQGRYHPGSSGKVRTLRILLRKYIPVINRGATSELTIKITVT